MPISSTLDTAGPMTKNVIDNAIVFNSIMGYDNEDDYSKERIIIDYEKISNSTIKGKKLGVFKGLLDEPLYKKAITDIQNDGGVIIEFDPPKIDFSGFIKILDVDMKNELPKYLSKYSKSNSGLKNISDIINFNSIDSLKRSPYGQGRFEGIISNSTSIEEFELLKLRIKKEGERYFDDSNTKVLLRCSLIY